MNTLTKSTALVFAALVFSCSKKEETPAQPTATATAAPTATESAPPVELPDAMAFIPDAAAPVQPTAKPVEGTGLTEADYEEQAIAEINEANMASELQKLEGEIAAP